MTQPICQTCGTYLDPDSTCFACRTADARHEERWRQQVAERAYADGLADGIEIGARAATAEKSVAAGWSR